MLEPPFAYMYLLSAETDIALTNNSKDRQEHYEKNTHYIIKII